jgi:hypothetical protein
MAVNFPCRLTLIHTHFSMWHTIRAKYTAGPRANSKNSMATLNAID